MDRTTLKHVILALPLSLVLTLTLFVIHLFYPYLVGILGAWLGWLTGGNGTSLVAGGTDYNRVFVLTGASLVTLITLVTPALFVFCFLLLQLRSVQPRRK